MLGGCGYCDESSGLGGSSQSGENDGFGGCGQRSVKTRLVVVVNV